MPPVALLPSSYGGVALDLAVVDTAGGRDLAIHNPSRGDLPVVDDRGRAISRTSVEVLFVERANASDPKSRFLAFKQLIDQGKPQIFRHPLEGSYLARVERFDHRIDSEDNEIQVSCDFIAVGELQAVKSVVPANAITSESVFAATALARSEIQEFNGEAPSLDVSDAAAENWDDTENLSPRRVALELQTSIAGLQSDATELTLSSRIDRWPSFKAFVGVQAALREAAKAVTTSTAETFSLEVRATTPLRRLVSMIYGARLAEERLADVLALNDIDTPNAVKAGTVLTLPAASGAGR